MGLRRCSGGFTLIEVLMGIVIVTLVGVASYTGFFILNSTVVSTRNNLNGAVLSQSAIEEVRESAKNDFDGFDKLEFEDIDQVRYPGFHRVITVTEVSSELKKVDILVTWSERGQTRRLESSFFMSRPSDPFPCNITGTVTDAKTKNPIVGARVEVWWVPDGTVNFVALTDANGYYTFVDGAGNYQLKSGTWHLQVSAPSYATSQIILVRDVASQENRVVDVTLEPLPVPGKIIGQFVSKSSGSALQLLELYVKLYQRGEAVSPEISTVNGEFTIPVDFETAEQACFTVASDKAFWDGWVGDFCDPNGWGKPYNFKGWSSSVVRENSSVVCGNPYYGSVSTDRICLNPGDTVTLPPIPLVPIPKATVTGIVRDSTGVPVVGGHVDFRWPQTCPYGCSNAWLYSEPNLAYTDANGVYRKDDVPAVQSLFPDEQEYSLSIQAEVPVEVKTCCEESSTMEVFSDWYYPRPVSNGDTVVHDFTVVNPLSNIQCGGVRGSVVDGRTSSPISGSWITFSSGVLSFSATPDGTGFFEIKDCVNQKPGFCMQVGEYDIEAGQDSSVWYPFGGDGQAGGWWYNYAVALRDVDVVAETVVNYGTLKLLKKGSGTIRGKVVIAGSTVPVVGALVNWDAYSDGKIERTITTGDDGVFIFSGVRESWPPPDIVGNTYYNQTARKHKITVGLAGFTTLSVSGITLNNGQTKDVGTLSFVLEGAV